MNSCSLYSVIPHRRTAAKAGIQNVVGERRCLNNHLAASADRWVPAYAGTTVGLTKTPVIPAKAGIQNLVGERRCLNNHLAGLPAPGIPACAGMTVVGESLAS